MDTETLTSAVRGWLRRPPAHPFETVQPVLNPAALGPEAIAEPEKSEIRTAWPATRLALTNRLWGTGFIVPGGETEVLRLARPLGVSAAASLLILGVGSGGPASVVTCNLGAWVTGMDNDPSLLAAARGLITRSRLQKKVSIAAWNPVHPDFDGKTYHHCLALEPFHDAQPEPILDALVRALKPGGQVVITELAAPEPLKATDPVVRRWAELEHRDPADMLAPVTVTRMLGRVGLDVRVAEDMSQRHLEHAIVGWRALLHDLRDKKPSRQEAAQLVREAELWLLRRRLIRDGRLRMMRWNAMSRIPIA